MKSHLMQIRIDKELHARLREAAQRDSRSISSAVRAAIERYIKEMAEGR